MFQFTPLTDEEIKQHETKFKAPPNGVYLGKIEKAHEGISKSGLPMIVFREVSLLDDSNYSYLMKGAKDRPDSGIYYITLSPKAPWVLALAAKACGLVDKYKTRKMAAEDFEGRSVYMAVVAEPSLRDGKIRKYAKMVSLAKTKEEAMAYVAEFEKKAADKEAQLLRTIELEASWASSPEPASTGVATSAAPSDDDIPF